MSAARFFLRMLAFGAVLVSNTFAVTLYQQGFDSETPGLNATLSDWYLYRPSVDVVADNTFGIRCNNNAGNCVDLDGTYMQGVYMWSQQTFLFQVGFDYVLTFWLSGNQRDLTSTDTLVVSLGTMVQQFDLPGSAPWQMYTMIFAGDGSSGRIVFDHRGNPNPYVGDNIGIVLDDLQLEEISLSSSALSATPLADTHMPEPGTAVVLAAGLGALLWMRQAKEY